jgi:hypothetical protein
MPHGEPVTFDSPDRYSDRPLPPYKHVPGRTPHPIRDPRGHSYCPGDEPELDLPDLNHASGLDDAHFRYGMDLFNEGYWWESHETMEQFWHASGMGTPAGHALQAIIQCAAAHLKTVSGQPGGARKLFITAEDHVHQAEGMHLGLDLIGMLAETGAFVTGDSRVPARLVPSSYSGTGNP